MKFSIVIPVFNAVAHIEGCIESILNQTYKDFELIIIDAGSKDGTVDILKKYDTFLQYWKSEPDRGQTDAINKGFRLASGNIFSWINADERYLPDTLRIVNQTFLSTRCEFCYGNTLMLNEAGSVSYLHRHPPINPHLYTFLLMQNICSDAAFWTKELHLKTGSLDEANFSRLYMDKDWFVRLTHHLKKSVYTDIPLSRRFDRETAATNSSISKDVMKEYNEKIFKKHCAVHQIPFFIHKLLFSVFLTRIYAKLSLRLRANYQGTVQLQQGYRRFNEIHS